MSEPTPRGIEGYARDRRARSRVRKVVLLILLIVLLALFAWSAMFYAANRRLPFPAIETVAGQQIPAPTFLYAISGPAGPDALEQPIGVAVTADERVFVVDGRSRVVRAYQADGTYLFTFSALVSAKGDALQLPARVTIGPDGNVWVTDRRLGGIFIFSPEDGSFIREFQPSADLVGVWGPLALGFSADRGLYVADVGITEGHQVVGFDSSGAEIARWGSTQMTANIEDAPGRFHYPNGIAFSSAGDVFVSDMSNRRIQIFSPEGTFKDIIETSGSPLGIVFDAEDRLYVVDPFAHSVDVYDAEGKRLTGFGGPGVGLGRFQYPSDIALDETGRIFVSDRENNQVQVWGWPSGVIPPIALPEKPVEWGICLSPLLLLLIPLLRRRTAFVATPDFIDGMIDAGGISAMADRRYRWIVTEPVWALYADRVVDEVRLSDLLRGEPYSETDVADLMTKAGVDEPTAIVLVMSQRSGRLATEDEALAAAAHDLSVRTTDCERFLADHAGGTRGGSVRSDPEN